MLIKFTSEVGGFVMFGDVALKLLRMSGHSGSVPGAIGAEQMTQALQRLEAQVHAQTQLDDDTRRSAAGDEQNNHPKDGSKDGQKGGEKGGQKGGYSEGAETPVALAQRAFPLLEMMRRASTEACAIQWRQG